MSEYQYYEFRAVDRPLTAAQMSELRKLSTRAEITPTSFSNTYDFGSFRGDPHELMERYFDAHVYVSNFGLVNFILRLPGGVLPENALADYVADDGLNYWTIDGHIIIEWELNIEPIGDWVEGEGWMERLLPIRDELVRGDYRSLYIGWLSTIADLAWEGDDDLDDDGDDVDEEEAIGDEDTDDDADEEDAFNELDSREPPVPAGLGSLTSAQIALAEFLLVDDDLIAVAAQASAPISYDVNSAKGVMEWVDKLPEQEVRAIAARIIQGDGSRVQIELQSRFFADRREVEASPLASSGESRRTIGELLSMSAAVARERERKQNEEKERLRNERLAEMLPRVPELWQTVYALAKEQKSNSYAKACSLLVDIRDACAHSGRGAEFEDEFVKFLGEYSHSAAIVRRVKEAGLLS